MSQISAANVSVQYAGVVLFAGVTVTVSRGDRWGVVGRNGSGKTTLVNVLAGRLEPASGMVTRASGLRITLLDQHRDFGDETVWSAAAQPFAEVQALETTLADLANQLSEHASAELLEEYDRQLERFAQLGGYTYQSRVDAVLEGLGFDAAQARTQPVAQLSGGEAGRVALARQLVAPADVLILDEPTNHLDLDTTRWLEQYLRQLDGSVLIISHDREFLQNAVDRVLHLENRTAAAYRGSYHDFVRQHAERRLAQEHAYQTQQKTIAAEEEYIRRNIAGQNSRQAKGRRTRLARLERLSPPPGEQGTMALRLEPSERGGDQVLVARDLRVAVGERTLIDAFTARITRGEVIGLIGANGTGKSTLLRVIAGGKAADAGELRVGESTRIAYYRQDLAQVPLGRTLYSIIHDERPHWDRGQVQGHLGRFGFSGAAVQRSADTLSGGERARVALALLMLTRANFLLFDEPTNHLDIESIEALEDALDGFDGTVLLVSHDRALLRNTVTRIWSLQDHRIEDQPMGFDEWEALTNQRRAAAARRREEETAAAQQQRRQAARQQQQNEAVTRASTRALQKAVRDAETEVHRLERQIAELRQELEDPQLYVDAAAVRQANELKKELDALEEELVLALERWTNAADALSTA